MMPSCKDITEHSSDYLDRNLPWWKRPGYWLHLAMCVHCRRYVEQLKLTVNTISKLPDATPPGVTAGQIQKIVEKMKQSTKE
ncbi:MAG: zf-HC2 domain-containing protein [Gammaproteobacteria bacterium]|nr:zf-HC2 domain-containing protein [Gammaproteobacteria bacterium]